MQYNTFCILSCVELTVSMRREAGSLNRLDRFCVDNATGYCDRTGTGLCINVSLTVSVVVRCTQGGHYN